MVSSRLFPSRRSQSLGITLPKFCWNALPKRCSNGSTGQPEDARRANGKSKKKKRPSNSNCTWVVTSTGEAKTKRWQSWHHGSSKSILSRCNKMIHDLLVLSREWMAMGVAGMITSDEMDHSIIPCVKRTSKIIQLQHAHLLPKHGVNVPIRNFRVVRVSECRAGMDTEKLSQCEGQNSKEAISL